MNKLEAPPIIPVSLNCIKTRYGLTLEPFVEYKDLQIPVLKARTLLAFLTERNKISCFYQKINNKTCKIYQFSDKNYHIENYIDSNINYSRASAIILVSNYQPSWNQPACIALLKYDTTKDSDKVSAYSNFISYSQKWLSKNIEEAKIIEKKVLVNRKAA